MFDVLLLLSIFLVGFKKVSVSDRMEERGKSKGGFIDGIDLPARVVYCVRFVQPLEKYNNTLDRHC